ncbi:MAG: hypothetical protein KBT36_05535 [Kurthia sp.]|nr:hypothetical protein [Candidatus Kurthia equi]
MNYFMINSIVGSSIDSVSSLTDDKSESTTVFEAINFTTHDIWLYAVAFIGLLTLALVILLVMKRSKVHED